VVHSGAAGFNECDLYDVRPLVQERSDIHHSHKATIDGTWNRTTAALLDRSIAPDNTDQAHGWFLGEYAGYKVGGDIRRNTASPTGFGTAGDEAFFDCGVSQNRATGASAPSNANGAVNAIVAV